MAVKTCKECSPDIMDKFMSEAGKNEKFSIIIQYAKKKNPQSLTALLVC